MTKMDHLVFLLERTIQEYCLLRGELDGHKLILAFAVQTDTFRFGKQELYFR